MLLAHRFFSTGFGFWICQAWRNGLALINTLARLAGRVYQHRTGLNELLNFEALQAPKKRTRALYVDAFMKRIIFIGEVKVCD